MILTQLTLINFSYISKNNFYKGDLINVETFFIRSISTFKFAMFPSLSFKLLFVLHNTICIESYIKYFDFLQLFQNNNKKNFFF